MYYIKFTKIYSLLQILNNLPNFFFLSDSSQSKPMDLNQMIEYATLSADSDVDIVSHFVLLCS